jgi:23S rRNA pseudouridine2457 synthase
MLLILMNKPYGVLTRFQDPSGRPTLADYIQDANVYPVGRLDQDSEGLVILTDDGKLQHRLSDPAYKVEKTYLVQVEGLPDNDAFTRLRQGVQLKDGLTLPAEVKSIAEPQLWDRVPPIRVRASIPTSWLQLTITEGRNRQVRRMTAAVGYPTLRLIRWAVGPWSVEGLQPGQWRSLDFATMSRDIKSVLRMNNLAGKKNA